MLEFHGVSQRVLSIPDALPSELDSQSPHIEK